MKLFDKVELKENGAIFTILGLEGSLGKITKVKVSNKWYSFDDFNKIFTEIGETK